MTLGAYPSFYDTFFLKLLVRIIHGTLPCTSKLVNSFVQNVRLLTVSLESHKNVPIVSARKITWLSKRLCIILSATIMELIYKSHTRGCQYAGRTASIMWAVDHPRSSGFFLPPFAQAKCERFTDHPSTLVCVPDSECGTNERASYQKSSKAWQTSSTCKAPFTLSTRRRVWDSSNVRSASLNLTFTP